MATRMRIWPLVAGLVTIQAACGVTAALAQEPVPVKREILALYDGAQEGEAGLTRIHRFAEMPLNHLGLVLRFRDVRAKLPAPAEMVRYRGVLTWFAGSVADGNAYLAWANEVARMNLRYVILGHPGVAISSANILAANRLLESAGVRHTGEHVAPTLATRVMRKDANLIEFECRLDRSLPDYPIIDTVGAGTQIGLMLETPPHDGKRRTVLVAIGGKGGYAALNYEFCHQRPPLYQGKWLVDPFAFFRAAFDVGRSPIPDTTTASGNRLYFSRVKSEGWTRLSRIEGFRDASMTAGDVVLRELVARFGDLPATIDRQEKEVASSGRRARQAQLTLRRLSASPNVDLSRRRMRTVLSRFDPEYPSISNLSPLVGAGPDHLVNEPMSDEAGYGGTSAVGENGFSALEETLANTDSPRRLKPFNLNYHAHAGEYPALLRSVQDRLRAASLAALTPVPADRYAAIVDGFFSTRIDRVGDAAWRISNRGGLQTVRFDAGEGREVDLQASIGVIGQRRNGSALYVALDESTEPALVVLATPASSGIIPPAVSLIQSRWLVRGVAKDACAVSFEAQGYGEGSFTWSGAAAGRYDIAVARAGREVWRGTAQADSAGRLEFVVPIGAIDPVTVRMSCAGAGRSARH